jgi:hypothetical protein
MTGPNEMFWSYALGRPSIAMPCTQTTNWSISPFRPVPGKSATRIAMPTRKTAMRAAT